MIRTATEADVPQIVELGAAMHAESPRYRDLSFSRAKLADLALKLIHGVVPGGVLVAEKDGILVGLFGFIVTETFFGDDLVTYDIAVYVTPASRGGSAFLRMTRAAEHMARDMGARHFQVGVSTGIHASVTARCYERMGYADAGAMLSKGL